MGAYFKATLKGDIKAQAAAQMRARARKLEILLEQEAGQIIQRTQAGQTVTGGAMAKYSDEYREYKTKKGRKPTPDLTFTGSMLKSIRQTVKISGNIITGTMYFLPGGLKPGAALKAFYNNKLRPFFGLSGVQKRRIIKGLNSI